MQQTHTHPLTQTLSHMEGGTEIETETDGGEK